MLYTDNRTPETFADGIWLCKAKERNTYVLSLSLLYRSKWHNCAIMVCPVSIYQLQLCGTLSSDGRFLERYPCKEKESILLRGV